MPRHRRAALHASTLAVLTALVTASCSPEADDNDRNNAGRDSAPSDRTTHADGDGVLSASSAAGGVSVLAPGHYPWDATFGSYLLCVTEPGASAVVTGIRTEGSPDPEQVGVVFRTVPVASERTDKSVGWSPVLSVVGTAPNLAGGRKMGGTFSTALPHEVTQPCEGEDGVLTRFTELLIEMRGVGVDGAEITKAFVDYTSGGKRYALEVDVTMLACGEAVVEHC